MALAKSDPGEAEQGRKGAEGRVEPVTAAEETS